MEVCVRLFARARELAGASEVLLVLPERANVAHLRAELAIRHPELQSLLRNSAIAVDAEFAEDSHLLSSGAEVALIPPVSGGGSS